MVERSLHIDSKNKNELVELHEPSTSRQNSQKHPESLSKRVRPDQDFTPGLSPKDIMPIPTTRSKRNSGRGRPKGTANVITSLPFKNDLIKTTNSRLKKSLTRKLFETTKKKSKRDLRQPFDEENEDGCNVNCIFCARNFCDDCNGDKWVQCLSCRDWCHEDCEEIENIVVFICEICK